MGNQGRYRNLFDLGLKQMLFCCRCYKFTRMQSELRPMCSWTHENNDVTRDQWSAPSQPLSAARISLPRKQPNYSSLYTSVQPRSSAIHGALATCYDSVPFTATFTSSCLTSITLLDKSDTRHWIRISHFNENDTEWRNYLIARTQTKDTSAKLLALETVVNRNFHQRKWTFK